MTTDVPPPAPRTGDAAVDGVLDRLRDRLADVPAEDLEARRQLFDGAHRDLRTLLDRAEPDRAEPDHSEPDRSEPDTRVPEPTVAAPPAPVVREPDEW